MQSPAASHAAWGSAERSASTHSWIGVVAHDAGIWEPPNPVLVSVNVQAPAPSQLACAAVRSAADMSAAAHAAIGVAPQLWARTGEKCSLIVGSDIVAQNLPVEIDALVPSNAQKAT